MNLRWIGVLPVALFLVPSACGGSSGPGSGSVALITLAADRTEEAGTARVSMEMEMDAPTGMVTATAEGVVDMSATRGAMTMEMTTPEASETNTIESVFDGTIVYMKMPMLAAQLPGNKPWVSIDLQKAGEEFGLDLGALMQSSSSDPSQTLQFLRGASGEVETIGEEEVRGMPATHYRASILFDKIVDQAPSDVRPAVKTTIDLMKEWVGSEEMPIDVWIDDEGRMVRQKQAFEYESGPAAGTAVSMTMDMYDFGVDVDVEVPPQSQVTDLAALLEKLGKGRTAP